MAKNNDKSKELTSLDDTRLAKELDDTYRQLFTLRLQVATRQLQTVKSIGETRRKIARIKTIQRQRQLVAAGGGR